LRLAGPSPRPAWASVDQIPPPTLVGAGLEVRRETEASGDEKLSENRQPFSRLDLRRGPLRGADPANAMEAPSWFRARRTFRPVRITTIHAV